MSEEFGGKNGAGAIWIHEKDGKKQISGVINRQKLVGVQNSEKRSGSEEPDYLIVKIDANGQKKSGKGWKGETKCQRQRLNFFFDDFECFTAVLRDRRYGHDADATVFALSAGEFFAETPQAMSIIRKNCHKSIRNRL